MQLSWFIIIFKINVYFIDLYIIHKEYITEVINSNVLSQQCLSFCIYVMIFFDWRLVLILFFTLIYI